MRHASLLTLAMAATWLSALRLFHWHDFNFWLDLNSLGGVDD